MTTVLVVGAQSSSLGAAIAHQARGAGYHVVTAGLHDEDFPMDAARDEVGALSAALSTLAPHHVVCTIGVNQPEQLGEDLTDWYDWHFRVNVIAPMRLLDAWWRLRLDGRTTVPDGHYVAISSNSARIPRSGSAAYCASKAALSMALRVKAREGALDARAPIVYGYEPGLIAGTPMTAQTAENWPGQPLTRMRNPRLSAGLPASAVAWQVVQNLTLGPELGGCLFRLDADEG